MYILRILLAVVLLTSSFSLLSAPPLYTITDLGTFGGTSSNGYGVNDIGQVTGWAALPAGVIPGYGVGHAFVTDTNGVMTDLGTLDGYKSVGKAINNSGQVTGNANILFPSGNFFDHAFITTPDGEMTDLGDIRSGVGQTRGYGINDSGQVVGTFDSYHTFVTDSNGVMTDLETLGDGSSNNYDVIEARAINNNGQITGGLKLTIQHQYHAFVTEINGAMTDLGTLDGYISFGRAINNSGQVTGYANTLVNNAWVYHAFITTPDGEMTDIGTLGGKSFGNGINDSGQVVGYSLPENSQELNENLRAFIWEANEGMVDLNDLVIDLSASWSSLLMANDISNTGYITGYGIAINGERHAFLLTPVDTTPPKLFIPDDMYVEPTAILTPVEDIGNATAIDDFYGEIVISNDAPEGGFPLGVTEVVWTATDVAGNVATATQIITVQDTTPPVLTIPEDITIIAESEFTRVHLGIATATDLFTPIKITSEPLYDYEDYGLYFIVKAIASTVLPVGTTEITWKAVDANGNESTDTQIVTIEPNPKAIVITDIPRAMAITKKSVIIEWKTNIKSDSYVIYDTSPDLGLNNYELISEDVSATQHNVALKDLEAGQIYYYRVVSMTPDYFVVSDEMSFTVRK